MATLGSPRWRARPGSRRGRFLREVACVDSRLNPLDTPDCRRFRRVPGDGLAIHPYVPGHRPGHMPSGDRIDNLSMGNLGWLAALTRRLVARGRIAPALEDIYIRVRLPHGHGRAGGDPAAAKPVPQGHA